MFARGSLIKLFIPAVTSWAVAFAGPAARGADWRVTLRNPGEALGATPVVVATEAEIPPGDYALRDEGNGLKAPARVFRDAGKTYFAAVLPKVPADATLSLLLRSEPKSELSEPGVEIRPAEGKNLEVLVGGKPFTVYRTDEPTKPYFFPVFGPTGDRFTRSYPMEDVGGEARDHPHQRSLWFTHGNVNGVDFWASDPLNKPNPRFGKIQETSRKTVSAGAAVGVLRTTNDWIGPEGKTICQDERVVRFYDVVDARILDFEITIRAGSEPVTFGDTKEGMFGVRVASSMDVNRKTGGKITNAGGIEDEAAWGKASPWVDYTGPVGGKTVGIAILNHPESFRHPTTWHVRTYGLFAANPFGYHDFGQAGRGDHEIRPGGSIAFRYRLILHEGDTKQARIADAYRAYAQPPRVEIVAD